MADPKAWSAVKGSAWTSGMGWQVVLGLTASPAAGFPSTLRILSQNKIFLGPMAFRQEWFPDPPGLKLCEPSTRVCIHRCTRSLVEVDRLQRSIPTQVVSVSG